MEVHEKTKYPEIFKEVYWGSFKDIDKSISDEIIENRNKFVEDNDILYTDKWDQMFSLTFFLAEHITLNQQNVISSGYEFDHPEVYCNTSDEIVIICSNYGDRTPPPDLEMSEYIKLYNNHPDTHTYIGRYSQQEVESLFEEMEKTYPVYKSIRYVADQMLQITRGWVIECDIDEEGIPICKIDCPYCGRNFEPTEDDEDPNEHFKKNSYTDGTMSMKCYYCGKEFEYYLHEQTYRFYDTQKKEKIDD